MKYLLLGLIFLAGCDNTSTHSGNLGYTLAGDTVKEVKLSDGTPCAVFQGIHGGGISCNWK